ncbi:hypothetical protein AU468_08655 [Alkalispirochaeta sphaeroplastigenens]|uniref:PASTA domain-containing protein n=1 Tax=Alkalispirochaeta sphaeroplastigenens TaxID=1187066 RepID=A0A2S4JNP1_9SPIO|nr:penicillin-binding protein [Alkalispirochaeta sphaeroplastigenens]POR01144.1 hypothetical protein AU468_08655 [Alkalispirochaeta sphaeroplastigenens]
MAVEFHRSNPKRARENRNSRTKITTFAVILIWLVLIVQYGNIMIPGTPAAARSSAPLFERGPILDRRGRILAIQTNLDTITAWRPHVRDLNETARILGDILDQDHRLIAERLVASPGFVTIERTITPSQSRRIRAELKQGNLRGIHLQPDLGRSYPEGETAAAVIGYSGVDNVGLAGIEYMFSEHLLPPGLAADQQGSSMGNQVFLTLDLAIQTAADDLGKRLLSDHQADAVMILVAEAKTGALLAMSSQPSFNPNTFHSYSREARKNPAISRIYEPGSVFKVYSMASFLELGGITPESRFDASRAYSTRDGGFRITDIASYGMIGPREVIQYSSNVGAAFASEAVEEGPFYTMLSAFGFGSPTRVELNGEERGLLAPPDRWSGRSKPTLAIGQEVGVTALQMVTAATPLANEGILLRPRIVDRIVSPSGEVIQRFGRDPIRQVLSPATVDLMLSYMESATSPGGTARRIRLEGVSVAAKTGTAEVFDPRQGGYSDTHFLASTLALVPARDPQLIVYLVIDHPRGEYLGGRIAAPAVGELLNFLAPYYGIPRENDTPLDHSGRIVIRPNPLPEVRDTMPDLSGLPLRSVLPLLGRDDLVVTIDGSGYVVGQRPPPGTPLGEGAEITLELE